MLKPNNKKKSNFKIWITSFIVLIVASLYGAYSYLSSPVDINIISNSEYTGKDPLQIDVQYDANGCYYKKIECFTAPCEPILFCPDSTPQGTAILEPEFCAQVVGSCKAKDGSCYRYSDSCQKARFCLEPAEICDTIVFPKQTPPPDCSRWFDGCNTCGVVDGQIAGCTRMACKDGHGKAYCLSYATPTSTPQSTAIPIPIVGNQSGNIRYFEASNPCGVNSFANYKYECSRSVDEGVAFDSCTDFKTAMIMVSSVCKN